PPPPPTNQSLVRVREWPSERKFAGGREVPARRREFWRRFAVTRRCLATAVTNLLSSG
ncbi:hypothetical protein A2U01_0108560, partial [Trifolium medium]|nr:hypothetical protein [Trifolium medium]